MIETSGDSTSWTYGIHSPDAGASSRGPALAGEEAAEAWLDDASEALRLFGPPLVPLERMIDLVADRVERGMPGLGKPTGFEVRDGAW